MIPSANDQLATDLAALRDDSRRDPLPLDEVLRSPGVYRNDRPGAKARRDALADERRVQLALMPLSLSHVYAHRIGRAAGGATAIACALTLLAFVADPMLLRVVQWIVPGLGLNLGTCAAIAAAKILVAYVAGNWIGEWYFARKMRQAIETHDDVYSDLDHLARGPIDVGRELVRKVDTWSVGLAIAGVASLASMFAYLVVVAGAFRPASHLLSSTGVFVEHAATSNLGPVVYALFLAFVASVFVARACRREHRFPGAPSATRWLSHWLVLPLAFVAGIATLYISFRMIHHLDVRHALPSQELRFGLAIGGEVVLLAFTVWGALFWRRIERKRIGER
jgi:hypothetical protein